MKWGLLILLLLVLGCYGEWINRGTLWGVNIHFTHPRPGEAQQVSRGYSVARMDFNWEDVERVRGQYTFTDYDNLFSALTTNVERPVVCYWILDYSNRLYNNGLPPNTVESINAFVNFAVASITHFKGRGIIWEMWNEPNGGFWPPKANATAYTILAKAVGAGIRSHPEIRNEIYVGPALSTIDFEYAETVMKEGALQYFDAFSVHPYRGSFPETVVAEYQKLKSMLAQYAPSGKNIPILSGEWGYSTCLPPCAPGNSYVVSDEVEAKFLTRMWLINVLNNVPVSIYYDYQDDGSDITQREENFGTVRNAYNNATVPHVPKPAYNAAVVLQNNLGHLNLLKRVDDSTKNENIYVLAFSPRGSQSDTAYAVWKTTGVNDGACTELYKIDCGSGGISKQQCESRGCCFDDPYKPPGPQCFYHPMNTTGSVTFNPVTSGCFKVIDLMGNAVGSNVCGNAITLQASDSPRYLLRQ